MKKLDVLLDNNKYAILLITLLTALLYLRCISYGFVLDDTIVYDENKFVDKGFSGIWDIVSTESFTGYFGEQQSFVAGARYRPLSIVTFAIEKQFFGKSPMTAHIVNLILYVLCGLVVLNLLKRINFFTRWKNTIPLIGAILFIVHPIHSEAVANIKGRDEILCLLFSIATLNLSLDYYDRPSLSKKIGAMVLFFLGLLSKENAITFLFVIPLTLVFFRGEKLVSAIKKTWFIWIPAILYLIIRTNVIGYFFNNGATITDLMNNPFVGMRIDEKISTIILCIDWYIKLLFIPHPLTHDYYPYHVPKIGFDDWLSWVSMIILLIIVFFSFYQRKKYPVLWYCVLFFIATISLVSNVIFPVGTFMNERFLFIPSVAWVILICSALNYTLNKFADKEKYIYSLVGLVVLIFCIRTFTRVPAWMSGDTLNLEAIKVSKNSARINLFTGVTYFHMAEVEADPVQKKRHLDEATKYIDRALYIYPDYGQGLNMKAGVLAEYHKMDGRTEDFLIRLVKVTEKRPDLQFIKDYLKYLNAKQENQEFLYNYYLDTGYNIFFKKTKRYDYAIEYLEEAYKIHRNNKDLLEKMIEVYSIVPTTKGIKPDQAEKIKQRLSDLKIYYALLLN